VIGIGRIALLSVRMLRYRVALMLWMFMLLGAGAHGGLAHVGWRQLAAALALGCSYIAATTLNDIADQDIDRVNHLRDRGRPLVSGEATAGDLYLVHTIASLLALGAAVLIGRTAVAIISLSLVISFAYSARPLRCSYRTYLAPLVLAIAYVLVPYWLGLVAARAGFGPNDRLLAGALLALFLARINLKDFRDREGDARFGKPTLLLRFGKRVTCLASLATLLLGNVLLLVALRPPLWFAVLLEGFILAIAAMLRRLWAAEDPLAEQVAIGIGAKMGNGLLLVVLCRLVLVAAGASGPDQLVLVVLIAALFAVSFTALLARPQETIIGYKG
jgi:4-hydroxybenzoate polyprenyltransferase